MQQRCPAWLIIFAACRLNMNVPCPSAHFRLQIASQLEAAPLAVAGMRVHASQLHAPSLVLLGDAGHGVSAGG